MSSPPFITWPHDDLIHAYWVYPRLILAGEHPGHTDPGRTREKINALVDAGMGTFVDLTQPSDGLPAYEDILATVAEERGVELHRAAHPIPDLGVLGEEGYDEILAIIHDATSRNGVYIHCSDGIGRTATVAGCLFVEQGLSFEGAMRTIKERRAGTRNALSRAPETHQQRDVISRRAEKILLAARAANAAGAAEADRP